MNAIIHPAVKVYILQKWIRKESGTYCILFLEAALLIEEGYGKVADELWYIHADADIRRRRLKESRNYTDEKIDRIFASQLSRKNSTRNCVRVIEK